MRSFLGWSAAICLLAGWAAPPANADITYDVNAVLTDLWGTGVGTLSGSFTTNDSRTQLIAANLSTAAASANGWTFAPVTYTLANAVVPATLLPQNSLRFSSNTFASQLDLYFIGGLTASGATLGTGNSNEHQSAAGTRLAVGTVVARQPTPPVAAVPEPSALAVAAICAPALLVYARRRRRHGTVAA